MYIHLNITAYINNLFKYNCMYIHVNIVANEYSHYRFS